MVRDGGRTKTKSATYLASSNVYKRFGRRAHILRVHEVYGRNRANIEVACGKRNSRQMETKIALHAMCHRVQHRWYKRFELVMQLCECGGEK